MSEIKCLHGHTYTYLQIVENMVASSKKDTLYSLTNILYIGTIMVIHAYIYV